MHRSSLVSRSVVALFLLTLNARAHAAPFKQGEKLLDVQLFQPGVGPSDFLNVRGAASPGHLQLSANAYLIYMRAPLRATFPDGTKDLAVSHQLGWDLSVGVGLWNRLIVGVGLPIGMLQMCPGGNIQCAQLDRINLSDQNFSGGGVGDIRLMLHGTILAPKAGGGFGLGVGATVTFPTADATSFVGEGNVADASNPGGNHAFRPTVAGFLAADYAFWRMRVGLNAGYLWRRDVTFRQLRVSDQVMYGLGVGLRALSWLEAIAEFDGRLALAETSKANSPHEVMLAARFRRGALRFDAGVGVGVLGDFGAPDVRAFAGVGFAGKVTEADADLDGVPDSADQCPNEPEDKDGFQDKDGCPDLDNDNDGIPDALDKCPNVAAVTASGCPLEDSDKDGVADDQDRCPNDPEDRDGFEDSDGCPDPDNDKDGIADKSDKCPDKPETFNGHEDEDGCPDTTPQIAKPTPPQVTPTHIAIGERVTFVSGKAELTESAKRLLAQVAEEINKHAEVKLVRIEGHTDNQGSKARNQRLSEERARTVLKFLVTKRVAKKRLQAVGYGSTRPVEKNDTDEGRAKNRRVEFIVVQ
ncbi:MAG: OmpA family protein [Deltaproteobacteria bacterium]|nr:OmpA family protein [Deltaproteobacteria bacterium]